MAMPPKDISAKDLFVKLTEAPRPSEIIDWPRKVERDGKLEPVARVRVRVLTMRDHDEARLRAHSWLKDERKMKAEDMQGPTVREVFGDAVAREVLAKAIVHVTPIEGTEESGSPKYPRIFGEGKDLESITPDELVCLFQAYQLVQEKYGPYENNLASEAEVTAWVKRLTEGAGLSPLSQASSHQLAELNISLSRRVSSLSRILESLLPSLDESSAAALSSLDIGTGLFGSPASKTTAEIISEATTTPMSPMFDDDVTTQKAAMLARRREGKMD